MTQKCADHSSALADAVQSRLYSESMAGPGKKSDGAKQDESEIEKLRRQDYWIQISRAKLLMDLVFVCAWRDDCV